MFNKLSSGLFLVLLVTLLSISACSAPTVANSAAESGETNNVIQVVGYGEVKGNPDIASIQMGVNLVDASLETVIENANQAIETISEALVSAGVARDDIRTTNYGIWPEDIYDRLTGEPTGERRYHADLTIEVMIRDLDRMGEFIQAGLEAGVNNIYGINFGLDDRTALESEAREAAIRNAKERAQELASGLGMNVGEPLSISEGLTVAPIGFAESGVRGIGGGGGGAPISPGQTTVTREVIVVFELKQ